jgi:ribose transport system substrate-binding protein
VNVDRRSLHSSSLKGRIMRKVSFVLGCLLLVAMVFVIGCGGETATSTTASPTTASVATTSAPSSTADMSTTTESTAGEGEFLGFASPTLSLEFFKACDNSLARESAAAGIKYQATSSEFKTAEQILNIENFVSMGATRIVIMGLDVPSLLDTMKKARQAGVKILVGGTLPTDPDSFDFAVITDQAAQGDRAARMAATWVDETFPEAPDGSIEVAIMEFTANETFKARSDALSAVETYTPKVKIVQRYEVPDGQEAAPKTQEYTQMLLTTNPNVKLILCYSDGYAIAANEIVMTAPGIDLPKFAIFACGWSDVVASAVADSATDKSVVRGTVLPAADQGKNFFDVVMEKKPVDENKAFYNEIVDCTVDNVYELWTPK